MSIIFFIIFKLFKYFLPYCDSFIIISKFQLHVKHFFIFISSTNPPDPDQRKRTIFAKKTVLSVVILPGIEPGLPP